MPGIVGVSKSNFKKIENPTACFKRLNKMAQALLFSSDQKIMTFIDSWYGIGCVEYPESYKFLKKCFAFKDNVFLAMEGEVFPEISEIPFDLKIDNPHVQRAEFCIEKYLEKGMDFVAQLNGSFAIAVFDSRVQKTYLLTDRFGSCPLYYTISNDELIFGSSVRSLILTNEFVGKNYDLDAMAELVSFERVLGEKTLFSDIKRIPPATQFIWDGDKKTIRTYWKITLNKPDSQWDNYRDAAADLKNRLHEAIKKRTSDNESSVALVSGGIDSRIMLALSNANMIAATFTNSNHRHSKETLLAIEVAKILGVQHYCIERNEDHYAKVAEQSPSFNDGMMTFAGLHSVGLHGQLAKAGTRAVLTGQLWDTMFKGYHATFAEVTPIYRIDPEPFRSRRMARSITDGPIIRRSHHQDLMMLALTSKMQERVCVARERVIQSIAGLIDKGVSIKDFSDLYILKQIYDRAGWGIFRGLKTHFVDRSPALDNHLLDFAIAAPLKWKKDGNLMRTVLKMVDKRMAKLNDANTNLPAGICSPWSDVLMHIKSVPRYTLNRFEPYFSQLSRLRSHKSGQEIFKMHSSWHDINALLAKSQLYRLLIKESLERLDPSLFDIKMIESLLNDEINSTAPSLFKLFEMVVTVGTFDKDWGPHGRRMPLFKKDSSVEMILCKDKL